MLNFRIIFRPVSLLFCTLLCCSTGIVSAQFIDIHGDTRETATTVTLGTSVSGNLRAISDIDYFRIEPSTRTFVSIFTTGSLNTKGSLQNEMGNIIQTDDNSGSRSNFQINALLEMETYFIAVNISGFGNFGEYDLHVNEVPVTELKLNTSVSGTIDPAGDVDYFSIVISTTRFVTIYTTGDDLEDTVGTLQNRAGTELAKKDDSSNAASSHFLIRARLNPGTYYIRVMGADTDTGNYFIQVDDDSIDDHSDIRFTATEIELDTSVSGTINPEDDTDYFSVEIIDTPTDVNIFTTGELNVEGILLSGTNTFLQADDNSGEGNNFLISTRLDDPGTYYIRVGSLSTGNYTLYVLTDDHGPTTETATIVSLNTPESGRIDSVGDLDYFSIEIRDTLTNVEIFTTGGLNTAGELINRGGAELAFDDGPESGGNFLITANLEPGIYYISVVGLDTGHYFLHVYAVGVVDLAPRISLIIPSTLIESTNEIGGSTIEIDGSTMIDVKHGEPFPVYISVTTTVATNSLLLTLDGPQDGALPTTLMTSALSAETPIWSELFVGNSTTTAVGQQNYRYCLAGTQNCSSTISVSYSSPAVPIVDVDDEIGSEWDFTLSEQTVTPPDVPRMQKSRYPPC